ncbi:MAG TPA: heparan-alpha-glucosaminide N-acetyltransferase domain-containing protein [Myxococcaceae bacterium]|nr:heparan-alpha-glucosaminide N-acetyltransferase domain-containing protein [Myxococcaceae bacterium]
MQPTLVPTSTPARIAGLDALRAVAVLAMVMGHTLDATLSAEARALPAMATYWSFRGVTAPLFLTVAGWAVANSLSRSGLQGWAIARRYLPRAALLLFCGYLLRWPGWALERFFSGEQKIWAHFLAADALHVIAGSLIIAIAVFGLTSRRPVRLGLVALLGIGLPLLAPFILPGLQASLPFVLRQPLVDPSSNFPLIPWSAYFFLGVLLRGVMVSLPRLRPPLIAAILGGTLALLLTWTAAQHGWGPRQIFFWRFALLLLIAAVVLALPERVANFLAPVGRASLWAYVLHLPITYGWSLMPGIGLPGLSWTVGKTLAPAQGLLLALAVTSLTVPLALLGKRYVSPLKKKVWHLVTTRLVPKPRPTPADFPVTPSLFTSEVNVRTRP